MDQLQLLGGVQEEKMHPGQKFQRPHWSTSQIAVYTASVLNCGSNQQHKTIKTKKKYGKELTHTHTRTDTKLTKRLWVFQILLHPCVRAILPTNGERLGRQLLLFFSGQVATAALDSSNPAGSVCQHKVPFWRQSTKSTHPKGPLVDLRSFWSTKNQPKDPSRYHAICYFTCFFLHHRTQVQNFFFSSRAHKYLGKGHWFEETGTGRNHQAAPTASRHTKH